MRILVVDDDGALRHVLRRALALGGYEVELARDGHQGLALAAAKRPHAVVLDVGLPGLDGLAVCRRLRERGDRVPVLMLTARDAVEDRIGGLDAGADDYLVKPFDLGELAARLRALLRRAGDEPAGELRFGDLELDTARHGMLIDGRFVALTRTELLLLELLMANPRAVLRREVIHERVWGCDLGPDSNALRVYVGYLRRKLATAGARTEIQTLRGVGYALRDSSL